MGVLPAQRVGGQAGRDQAECAQRGEARLRSALGDAGVQDAEQQHQRRGEVGGVGAVGGEGVVGAQAQPRRHHDQREVGRPAAP